MDLLYESMQCNGMGYGQNEERTCDFVISTPHTTHSRYCFRDILIFRRKTQPREFATDILKGTLISLVFMKSSHARVTTTCTKTCQVFSVRLFTAIYFLVFVFDRSARGWNREKTGR